MNNVVVTNKERVLAWFTGKPRERAMTALMVLEDCEKAGEWLPGASRMVRAALGKSNVAHRIYKESGTALQTIGDYNTPRDQRGWSIAHMLEFGLYARGETIDFMAIYAAASDFMKAIVLKAEGFYRDFKPISRLMDRLDAARPKPVFTSIGVSPTITETLKRLNFHFSSPQSIRVCPMRFEREERIDANGKKISMPVIVLEWPEGTVHGASSHATTPGYKWPESKCQACGHGIKNDFNWVPLLVDDSKGVPHALWVGTDCSKSLFGIKVKGESEFKGRLV
jgi:hypothetical protein